MEALLDDEDKDKKRPFFWRWFSILLGVLVVGGATLLYSKLISKSENAEAKIENSHVENTNFERAKTQNLHPNNQVGLAAKTTSLENQHIQKEDEVVNHSILTKKLYERDVVENAKVQHSSLSPKASSNAQALNLKKEVDANTEKVSERTTLKITNSTKLTSTKSTFKNDVEVAKIDNATNKTTSKFIHPKKLKTKHSKMKTELPNIQHQTSDISPKDITVINGKPMIQTSAVTYAQGEPRDEINYNPRYNAALKNYVPEVYDSITILTFKPVTKNEDVVNQINPTEQPKTKEPFMSKPFNLIMLAGLNMNKGFAGTVVNEMKWGFAPYIGAGLEKPISNKITMSSHIGFTYFNGLNTHKTVSSNVYSFGLDSSAISVYYKKMLQLYLPISMYYQIKPKHYLMGSIGASYLLNILSTFEEVKSSSAGFSSTLNKINTTYTSTTSKNQLGYQTGFNQLDVFLQAGYSYQVFKNSMLQLGVQQGLFDITKNTYFNNTIKNTQTRFSLGFKYSFNRNNH
jgi:hypothetical protein